MGAFYTGYNLNWAASDPPLLRGSGANTPIRVSGTGFRGNYWVANAIARTSVHKEMTSILKKLALSLNWLLTGSAVLTVSFVLCASRQGWEFDAVLSGSMEPVLHVGGLVVIKPLNASDVTIGDVISFKLPGIKTPICHRIIGVELKDGQIYFQTKGDANNTPDIDLVPTASVNGKAIYHIPYVGRLGVVRNLGSTKIDFLCKSLLAATLVIMPIGLLFIGLTLKETVEDLFYPEKKWRRDMVKIRKERLLSRKKILGLK